MAAMSAMPGMMPGMGAQPGQAPDFKKLFLAEKENVLITPHVWDLENIEERLLKKYGKISSTPSSSSSSSPSSKLSTSTKPKKELTMKDKIKAAQKANASGKRR